MSAPLPAPFDENMVAARGRFFACVGTVGWLGGTQPGEKPV